MEKTRTTAFILFALGMLLYWEPKTEAAEAADEPTTAAPDTLRKEHGMVNATIAVARLEQLKRRLRPWAERGDALAPYLGEQAAIIERLIGWLDEDRRKGGDDFFRMEVALQESELEMLLASLAEELDLLDRNRDLSVFAKERTVNVRDTGAVGDGRRDDGPAIAEAIARAAALGPGARVVLPAGRYAIATLQGASDKCHLLLNNLRDLTVEAEPGTTLIMKKVARAIIIQDCYNVTVRNLAIDFDPLPFTQGTIVAVDADHNAFDWELWGGYPEPMLPYFVEANDLRGTMRDPGTGDIAAAAGDPRVATVEPLGAGRYRLTALHNDGKATPGLLKGFKAGYTFVLHARQTPGAGPGINVLESRCVTLEGLRVYACHDHAFFVRESDGVKLRDCRAEPLPDSNRLACNNADGFHCPSNRRGPLIENCVFRRVNDDCVNIYSKCYPVALQTGPRQVVLDKAGAGAGAPGEAVDTPLYRPGDMVAFVNPNNGAIDAVARVEAVTRGTWKERPSLALRLDRPIGGLRTREALGKRPVAGREYVWHKAGPPIEHFAVNLNTKGDGFVIRGCSFGRNRASGLKIKCSNGVIENNRIERPVGACLQLLCELGWMEGWTPHNVIVRDNVFDDATGLVSRYGLPGRIGSKARQIRHIRIEGNQFINASNRAIQLHGAQDVTIARNRVATSRPILLDNCADVRVVENEFALTAEAGADAIEIAPNCDRPSIESRDNRVVRSD